MRPHATPHTAGENPHSYAECVLSPRYTKVLLRLAGARSTARRRKCTASITPRPTTALHSASGHGMTPRNARVPPIRREPKGECGDACDGCAGRLVPLIDLC